MTSPSVLSVPTALVVVAHPDDAEVAMGGTIARLRASAVRVVVAMLTYPEGGAGGELRVRHTKAAAQILDYEPRWLADPSQRQVSGQSETALVAKADELLRSLKPDAVFTHWAQDGHVDHRLTARTVAAAMRHQQADLYTLRPAEPRVAANARFTPTAFVDITDYADLKMKAVQPFTVDRPGFRALDPEAIELSDRYHGSLCGVGRAEAFGVERQYGLGSLLPRG